MLVLVDFSTYLRNWTWSYSNEARTTIQYTEPRISISKRLRLDSELDSNKQSGLTIKVFCLNPLVIFFWYNGTGVVIYNSFFILFRFHYKNKNTALNILPKFFGVVKPF